MRTARCRGRGGEGVSAQGVSARGVSARGVSAQWVCLPGDLCPGEGVCQEGGVCPSACPPPREQNDRCLWKHNLFGTTLKEYAKCFTQSNLMFCSGYVLKSDLHGNYRSVSLALFCLLQNHSQYHIIGVLTISGQELTFSLHFTVVCLILLHFKSLKL